MGILFTKLKQLFSGRQLELAFVGLENAGKSSLAARLSLSQLTHPNPTCGVDIKHFRHKNISAKIWDLGGQSGLRSPIQK